MHTKIDFNFYILILCMYVYLEVGMTIFLGEAWLWLRCVYLSKINLGKLQKKLPSIFYLLR